MTEPTTRTIAGLAPRSSTQPDLSRLQRRNRPETAKPTAEPMVDRSGGSTVSASPVAPEPVSAVPTGAAPDRITVYLDHALRLYRDQFVPNESGEGPRTFVTANVVAAPTAEEAEERALPQLRMMARLRTNRPLVPLETVEQAKADPFDAMAESIMASTRQKWFVGSGAEVQGQLAAFAAQHGVDEIMVSPVAGAYEGEGAEGRTQTLELIAARAAVAA